MLKHKFVIVSKDSSFRIQPETVKDLNYQFEFISNNTESLPKIYNQVLNSNTDFDYIYFLHSDVKLDITGLVTHVESIHTKYDVIGLCGCTNFKVTQSPLNWFCGSMTFPNTRWGCVTHGELGNHVSFFNERYPNILDHEVACIDGLCIIFSKKAILSGLRFDESLGKFDFYDTDISMQAILKYNLKLGVVVRQDLMHFSVGKSILNPKFLEVEKKFREKWNFPISQLNNIPEVVK